MTTDTTDTKKRTITLTDRSPVTIREDLWPIVAVAKDNSNTCHQTPRPDYEVDTWSIRVRQHADGRAIVYAVLNGSTAWTGTESRSGGELLAPGSDLAAAIARVGADCGIPEATIRDCVADLPAEDLDEDEAAMGLSVEREGRPVTGELATRLLVETVLAECPSTLDDGTGTLRTVVESAALDGSILPASEIHDAASYRAWIAESVAIVSGIVEQARADHATEEGDEFSASVTVD